MKKLFLLLCVTLALSMVPMKIQAGTPEAKYPCSLILNARGNMPTNAKGVALTYRVKRKVGGERISLSLHAQYLPTPFSLGDYDRYEGFAQVPGLISWQFRLYPTPEPEIPTWAGRIDDISGALEHAKVQVRLYNSETKRLGPVVLENRMNHCK